MSVLSPKRVILFVVTALLAAPLFANHPSPRLQPRMAFDEQNGVGVLFGGVSLADSASGLTHASDQTWFWVRDQWVQQFPLTRPPARSSQSMVYDSTRGRVLMFGGRKQSDQLQGKVSMFADFWAWQNGDWHQIETATHPPERESAGLAYDRERDRVILFGGFNLKTEGKVTTTVTLKDTWEFDGTDWHEVLHEGPDLSKPLLVFDQARHETILLGINTDLETAMYRWKPDGNQWQAVTPTTLPTCVNDAALVYQTHNQKPLLAGGVCSSLTPLADETWEWDGSNWTLLVTNSTNRTAGSAVAYDTVQHRVVRFGGSSTFNSVVESSSTVYKDLVWTFLAYRATPVPRSFAVFRRDPVRDVIWMLGGLSEYTLTSSAIIYLDDFWRYQDGQWNTATGSTTQYPSQCATPLSTFDTKREVLVVLCGGSEIFEWNGTEWKAPSVEKTPDARRFAGFAYDKTLQKAVLFGGYDEVNFRDDTWTWDGTTWTNVKPKTKPKKRGQMAMWYDPLAHKTLLYSGVGREDIDEHVTRFEDMWAFDGTQWSEVTVSGDKPGIRFGSQYVIDPNTDKLLLFGGLLAVVDPENSNNVTQTYMNDTWSWDGGQSKWTKIETERAPDPRQNGGFEYDSATGKFILFGGFAGNFYLSDVWQFDGTNWAPVQDVATVHRRRGTRP